MKNKTVAGTLALMLGVFGVHRFYLGKKIQGILHLVLFFFTLLITVEEDVPMIMIPALLGFIDAVLFFVMPQTDFDAKYNSRRPYAYQEAASPPRRQARSRALPPQQSVVQRRDPYRRLGIERFRKNDFLGAVEAFQTSLQEDYENPSTHFNLACSYSMLELPEDAFFHLEKAVAFGFDGYHKIDNHHALGYLRTRPEFEAFVANEYQIPAGLPAHSEDLLSERLLPPEENSLDVLDQLMQLGDLKEKGLITEEEFTKQKRRLLEE